MSYLSGGAGGGGGSATLAGLTDVALTTLVNNESLVYQSGTGKWVNLAINGSNYGVPYSELIGIGDGVTTTFPLLHTPSAAAVVKVAINGLLYENGIDFTVVGNNVIFASAPSLAVLPAENRIFAYYNDNATGAAAWFTAGNTGTTPATQFIGTTDAQDLNFRTNNVQRLNIDATTGAVTVTGDLIVQGTTTTVESTTVTVRDKNIELGLVAVPTDTTADGGGITLKGATDKTIIWTNADDSWHLNQNTVIEGDLTVQNDVIVTEDLSVTGVYKVPDNTVAAFIVREGASNNYISIDTTNGGEVITVGNTTGATAVNIDAGTGLINFRSGESSKVTVTAVSLTADSTHRYIFVTATGQTITLPAATGSGRKIDVKGIAVTSTVARTGTDTIDGATSASIGSYENKSFIDYATGLWAII